MDYQQAILKAIYDRRSRSHYSRGMQIYHNNFIENGIRALGISFPTLAYFLDESDFRALAKAYLMHAPKTSFDWADYGHSLPEFIMSYPQVQQFPYLSELAELDWYIHQTDRCFDVSFDADSFHLLSTQDPASLRFTLAPGFRICRFVFPVEQFHQLAHDKSLQQDTEKRALFTEALNNTMRDAINAEQLRSILLWRPEFKTQLLGLHEQSITLYKQLENNESIAKVFEHFSQEPERISSWLTEQITHKRIFGVQSIQ